MSFQIGIFDAGGETWHFYREDFTVVGFETLAEAEAKAVELAQGGWSREVIVLTLHGCFKTERDYVPSPPPKMRTTRIEIKTKPPELHRADDQLDADSAKILSVK